MTELDELGAWWMVKSGRFQVFFDGQCPLCRREIDWLRARDRARHEKIEFIDIASDDFHEQAVGKTFDELMAEIHGRTGQGRWVTGVEVFRHLYAAAGFRRLVAFSRWPLVRQVLDAGYRIFARYRTRLTGRCRNGQCQVAENAGSSVEAARSSVKQDIC